MKSRLFIALLLIVAVSAIAAPPSPLCGFTKQQAMHCAGCCATMKSCVLPQQNPAPQAATAPTAQASIELSAPTVRDSETAGPLAFVLAAVPSEPSLSAFSAPRLAMLCTFLI